MGGSWWSMAQKRESKRRINSHLSVILADDLIHKAIYWKLSIVCFPSFDDGTKLSLIGLRGTSCQQFVCNYACAYMRIEVWIHNVPQPINSHVSCTFIISFSPSLSPSAESPFEMRLNWCKFYANNFNSSFLIVCKIFIGFFIVVSTFQLRTQFFLKKTSFQLIINSFHSFTVAFDLAFEVEEKKWLMRIKAFLTPIPLYRLIRKKMGWSWMREG